MSEKVTKSGENMYLGGDGFRYIIKEKLGYDASLSLLDLT